MPRVVPCFAVFLLAACPADPGPGGPTDGGPVGGSEDDGGPPSDDPDGGASDGDDVDDGGATPPPTGPYLAAVLSSQDDQGFVVDVQVARVEDLRSLGFALRFDPALVDVVDRARVDEWLTSNGGQVLPLDDAQDDAAGEIRFVASLAGADAAVSTAAPAVVYRASFAWDDAPAPTMIDLFLDDPAYGVVQDGADAPLPGVVAVDLPVAAD